LADYDLAGIDLRDPGNKPVHRLAIMRCHQQNTLKDLKELLEEVPRKLAILKQSVTVCTL
jgi:hypothetical protein